MKKMSYSKVAKKLLSMFEAPQSSADKHWKSHQKKYQGEFIERLETRTAMAVDYEIDCYRLMTVGQL